jgi:transcriptional regulator with XRE-family HTH domain
MSIQELAARSGLNEHTISDIERGIRKPRAATVAKLAEALGIPVEELLKSPKAQAPRMSGQPSESEVSAENDDQPVPIGVGLQRMAAAGDAAREVARDWQRELVLSLEEGRLLTRYRISEMYSFHNELSRLYVDNFKSLLEGAKLGVVGLTVEGVNQYLGPDPVQWPQEFKEPLYEAGARIATLPKVIRKIEQTASEHRRTAAEQALYEEFHVNDHLSRQITQDPEWQEAIGKALAEVGA